MIYNDLAVRPISISISGWLTLGLALVLGTGEFSCRPTETHNFVINRRNKSLFVDDQMENYLMNFGYIPRSDRVTGNLRTETQLRDALRNLQAYGGIPVTGEMDDATKNLMKRPRCGLPDIPQYQSRRKRFTLHGQKWHHTNLTWSLRSSYFQGQDIGRVRSELYGALQVWSKHSKLTFQEVNSDDADILIYFERGYHGDGYAFDGRGQILAHAFFPGGGRGGDAHFDADEIWLLDTYVDPELTDGTSLFAVAAHEFGHSLGLSHSSVQGALMYPWYQGLPPGFELPMDDQHAIQQLYGAKESRLWGKIPNFEPVTPRRTNEIPFRTPRPTTDPRRFRPSYAPTTPRTPKYHYTTQFPKKYPTEPSDIPPDTCNTNYDAIALIRGETFIFKDRYFWRIGSHGLRPNYPVTIDRMWPGFPTNLKKIDAVYERKDKKIVFFAGKEIYVFDANILLPGYPQPLHSLRLPHSLDHIDAAMIWGHNNQTYLFSGSKYWKLNDIGIVEEDDYPRDMGYWQGIGYNIDAAFQWTDHMTYFFKGKKFWKFDDIRLRVTEPKLSAPFWMGCSVTNSTTSTEDDRNDLDGPFDVPYTSAALPMISRNALLTLTMFIKLYLFILLS